MSWDGYITNLLAKEQIAEAAIGTSEGAVWAKSANLSITDQELKALSGSRDAMLANGVKLGGRKFHVLRHDMEDQVEPHINLKSSKDESGKSVHATIFKTVQAYVIVVGTPDAHGGPVAVAACDTGSYLRKLNY